MRSKQQEAWYYILKQQLGRQPYETPESERVEVRNQEPNKSKEVGVDRRGGEGS